MSDSISGLSPEMSGGDMMNSIMSQVLGNSGGAPASTNVVEEPESEPSEVEATSVEEESSEEPKAAPQEEFVYVTDESGQRKKLKVDFTPEKVKKAYEMAAGMRKFQAERDALKRQLETLQPASTELEDYKQSFSKIQEALQNGGPKGLFDMLLNKEGAFEEFMSKEIEKRNFLENASPAERERYELTQKLEKAEREREKEAKKFEDFQRSLTQRQEQATEAELNSLINPAFGKHRFAGQLGDAVLEERLDKAVWTQALANLEELPENVQLTQALVEKEFREVASTFKRAINKQATVKAKEVVDTRKSQAQNAVAAKAVSGLGRTGDQSLAQEIAEGGGLTGALMKMMRGAKL